MTNPFRTETTLSLEADTRIQRYNLTVHLSGPFDRLKITYRSDPPLPTSDIVTLLAFGYARQQDEMATGSSHPAATVGASAIVSQALSTQTSGRIQRLFGVSRIKIDPNAGGVATTGGALITVEQQVAPELTITYATNTGVSQYRIIRLEWAVSDRMSIIGERDQGGVFGMEVQFRRRFR
jgi:translocation and assembly module TamB